MTKSCIIYCTTPNKESAIQIAEHLVNKKLIACCNIIDNITSIYQWKNEVLNESEFLMIMKTSADLYPQVEKEIKELHEYEIPEIISVPITAGSKSYLNWINEQTSV